jgi:hypothetical protein
MQRQAVGDFTMIVKLVVIGGKKAGMEIPISTPTFLIGRGEGCHIRPQCKFVNAVHCQISVDKDKKSVAIEDCSGGVGTFVNGEKIKWRYTLKNGDRIKVGTLELEVRLDTKKEVEKKQPAPKSKTFVASNIAAVDDDDKDIAQWLNEGPTSAPPVAAIPAVSAVSMSSPPVVCEEPVRKAARSLNLDTGDMLLLALLPLLSIAVLSMLFPIDDGWQFNIVKTAIINPWDSFCLSCRRVWQRPVWPWWMPVLMIMILVS